MKKKFYIKERCNPQLGTYYIPCSQMSKTAAKKESKSLYGYNTMLGYDTEAEYQSKITELRQAGERVH